MLLFLLGTVPAQISPGELVSAHAQLEGMSNCTKCHDIGKQVASNKCLDCHNDIKNLIAANRGYHASAEVRSKNCYSCHSDHHGRGFQIVRFSSSNFDHRKTGFELNGKHSQAKCTDCHQPKFMKDQKYKAKKNTFLGLQPKCIACHEDRHKKTVGENCNSCHNTSSFKPVTSFAHDRTKFKLIGRHLAVACEKCHKKETENGKEFQKFTVSIFSNCNSCHTDIHAGKLGSDCKHCHNEQGFRVVNTTGFDHNATNYPLQGKHQAVACKSCHSAANMAKPKHAACTQCHKDYHKGQFDSAKSGQFDCAHCHTVQGFSPALFSVEQHSATSFALDGSHLATPCASCHYKEKSWQFKQIGQQCSDCHSNVHGSEITPKYLSQNNCRTCHSVQAWQDITFDHQQTGFSLSGKHATLRCRACHFRDSESGKQKHIFVSLHAECTACHADVHKGQFAENGKTACLTCHSYNNWSPLAFDHNKTDFPLTGKHQQVACNACHKENDSRQEQYRIYKLGKLKCIDCHK
jgi:hypothetical protein